MLLAAGAAASPALLQRSGIGAPDLLVEREVAVVHALPGVGENLQSCHTAVVNGYVVEGHVPAADIHRMLKEKPAIAGIAAPGMPRGSPGMEVPGGARDPYQVLTFTRAGKTTVFARH